MVENGSTHTVGLTALSRMAFLELQAAHKTAIVGQCDIGMIQQIADRQPA